MNKNTKSKLPRFSTQVKGIMILLVIGSMVLTGCQAKDPVTTSDQEGTVAVTTEAQTGAILSAVGKFVAIEQGDYLHLTMATDAGETLDFFVLTDMAVSPESLTEGQKIQVTYVEKTQTMDPPGEMLTFLELLSLTLTE